MDDKCQSSAIFSGVTAVLLWSTAPLVSALLGAGSSYYRIVFFMWIFGSLVFTALNIHSFQLFIGHLKQCKKISLTITVFIASLFILLYYLLFYMSLQTGNRIQATILNYLWPLFYAIFVPILCKEQSKKLSFLDWTLIILAFLGATLIVLPEKLTTLTDFKQITSSHNSSGKKDAVIYNLYILDVHSIVISITYCMGFNIG
jgi:drug/metabolite transporter (DMT)-like permease